MLFQRSAMKLQAQELELKLNVSDHNGMSSRYIIVMQLLSSAFIISWGWNSEQTLELLLKQQNKSTDAKVRLTTPQNYYQLHKGIAVMVNNV